MMISSLPMYDWPELQFANDAFWNLLQDRLIAAGFDAPAKLSRSGQEEAAWLSPDLLLGQTCGYPFATKLKRKVTYLATPVYEVEGCTGPNYSSAIIVHRQSGLNSDNLRGSRFAFNSAGSWSGYQTAIREYGPLEEYFSQLIESGGHRQSARMVAEQTADIATIDAVCWCFLQRHEPDIADNLEVIGWSGMQPALPFITSLDTQPEAVADIRNVLNEVFAADEYREIGMLLALKGCEVLDPEIYMPLGTADKQSH